MAAPDSAGAPAAGGDTREGFYYALAAYSLWGVLPFYMKAVAHIPAAEVVAHRIVWSVPLAGLLLVWLGRTGDIARALRTPATLAQGALTAAIITINWGIYVWAIGAGRTVETALGYYINPLFSVFLAAVILGERLSRVQIVAIGLAVAAVALLTVHAGGLPWVSLGLTVSWGFYALFKKTLPVGAAQGFFLEVLLLSLPATAYILWLEMAGAGHFRLTGALDTGLLLFAGAVTAIPLILYANGAKLLRLSTIGIMQYIAPTMIFFVAVFAFGEPFDSVRAAAFALIWTALVLYSWSLLRERRRGPSTPAA
ncbi:MAG: permease [Alphaproteobacteria bacterium]|nr:MAG: permease [Alphaproteobacteria bacterium]